MPTASLGIRIQMCIRDRNFGAAGFAGAPGAGEQVGMAHFPAHQLGFQGLGHRRLTGHIVKGLGTVFPIQCLIGRHSLTPFQENP